MTDQTQTTTEHKITWVNDASNVNDRRMYVDGQQWAKVYGWDEASLNARCDILQEAMERPAPTPQPLAIGLDREVHHRLTRMVSGECDAIVYEGCAKDRLAKFDDDLRSLLALAAPAEGWQGIETAPKDGTEVLVMLAPKVIRLGWYFKRSSRTEGWCDENGKAINPTHWMPLPAAPTGETL